MFILVNSLKWKMCDDVFEHVCMCVREWKTCNLHKKVNFQTEIKKNNNINEDLLLNYLLFL